MLPTGLERTVLSVMVIVLVKVFAIVDFHIDDDPKSDAQVCCMVEHTFPQEPYRACHEQHATAQMDNGSVMCIHQCYYKAIGMFAADGKVNTDAYIKYRDELDPTLRDAFTYSMVVCAKVIAKRMNNNIAEVNKMRCSPLPYLFNRCLMEVGIGNCPPERWMNSEGQPVVHCNQPPLEVHPKDCCQLPSLIDEELLRNCKTLYGGEPLQRKLIYERGKCFVECALNATGTLVGGVLDQAKILHVIVTATQNDPAVMQLFQSSTLQCFQTVGAGGGGASNPAGCNSLGVDFVGCVNIKNFVNCPPHIWSNSAQCNALRQYILECPQPF
uniref:OBP47-like domain-containing protein n=1 Tax=Anopheles coluzzii TaxID=1518534 RepID=A0A8W7P3A1_ANOCL